MICKKSCGSLISIIFRPFIQRINLGLYALLGELGATGNYRKIAEELWPFVQGPPSTPMAELEQSWLADHRPARLPAN